MNNTVVSVAPVKFATTVANLVKSAPELDRTTGAVKVMDPKLALFLKSVLKFGSASPVET